MAYNVQSTRPTMTEAKDMMDGQIIPKVSYSMPVNKHPEQQYKQKNTAIDQVMLNKFNTHRRIIKLVVFSLLKVGGRNYPWFKIIQDQKGILYLLKQMKRNCIIANDLL